MSIGIHGAYEEVKCGFGSLFQTAIFRKPEDKAKLHVD
jgi:hypothetical protein